MVPAFGASLVAGSLKFQHFGQYKNIITAAFSALELVCFVQRSLVEDFAHRQLNADGRVVIWILRRCLFVSRLILVSCIHEEFRETLSRPCLSSFDCFEDLPSSSRAIA